MTVDWFCPVNPPSSLGVKTTGSDPLFKTVPVFRVVPVGITVGVGAGLGVADEAELKKFETLSL